VVLVTVKDAGLKSAKPAVALRGDSIGDEPVNVGGLGVELAAFSRQLRF
jgi:hypothetical protein